MKLYYDAAYGLLFICAGLGIGYFDAYDFTTNLTTNSQLNCAEICRTLPQKYDSHG